MMRWLTWGVLGYLLLLMQIPILVGIVALADFLSVPLP